MRFWLLPLLATSASAVQLESVALRSSLGTALEHVGLTPTAPGLEPRLAAFLERLSVLSPAVPALTGTPGAAAPLPAAPASAAAMEAPAPAALPAAAPDAAPLPTLPPRRALATQRTIAAVSAGLQDLDPERIRGMSTEQIERTASRLWEGVRPQAPTPAGDYYSKRYAFLDAYMRGRGYDVALRARDFAETYHTGTRKDGVTPEFQHQIEIALFLTTLKNVRDEQTALAAAFLHDVMEDYDVPREEMERRFGPELTGIVWKLTKTYRGQEKDLNVYFQEIAADPVASLVKGADRVHNVQSMIGVFSPEHQKEYLDEVDRYFLPMIKKAMWWFPEQCSAYSNIEHMLKNQRQLLRAMLQGSVLQGIH